MKPRVFESPGDAPADVETLRDAEGDLVTRVGSRWTYHYVDGRPIANERTGFSGAFPLYGPFTEVAR